MKSLRLAIVAQRFWPCVGSLEIRAGQLACGLADAGVEVTVVTARWHRHWPAEIAYHGIPVVRLHPPPNGRWNTWRWTRGLARWMQRHADQFDGVWVWGLMHEAQAVVEAIGSRLPVALAPERTGWRGDCFQQVRVSADIKRACLRASGLVAASPAARQELEAAGYPRERIFDVAPGVPLSPPRSRQTQADARDLLSDSNSLLRLAAGASLAVSTSRLAGDRDWEQLLAAWSIVARQKATARLWLAGEPPGTAAIGQRIEALGLGWHAELIGMFDDVECLLAAADVHVAPASDGAPQSILEAMAAGLPSVAIDVPVNRWLLGEDAAGLLVPAEDPSAMAAAILRLLDEVELAARLGNAGWQRAKTEFDYKKMIERCKELFENLGAKA